MKKCPYHPLCRYGLLNRDEEYQRRFFSINKKGILKQSHFAVSNHDAIARDFRRKS